MHAPLPARTRPQAAANLGTMTVCAVVVNKGCAALHDMVVDVEIALMVDESEVPAAIRRLFENENMARGSPQRAVV